MDRISSSVSQPWQLQTTKAEKQIPADFDLAKVKPAKPAKPEASPPLVGPTLPQDQVKTETYPGQTFEKEFKMPTLKGDIENFVEGLGTGEKAALGGAVAAGSLAAGNLKVNVPVNENTTLNLNVRTRSNGAAREAAENPAMLMFPDAKEPKGSGISLGIKTRF